MKALTPDSKFVRQVMIILSVILLFKITGYFTLTENIGLTRVLKVIIRISMTTLIWMTYQRIVRRGNIPSFSWHHTLAPILYSLYLFLGLASLLWSTDPGYSALQLVMNLESLIFSLLFIKTFILLRASYPEFNIRLSSLGGPAVSVILLAFIIGMYVDPDKFYRLTHGGEVARLGGYLMNPNELGMLAVVGIACCLVELTERSRRFPQLLMTGIMLYALVLTGSRSSMIAFMLVLFFFIQKSSYTKLKMAVYAGAVLVTPLIINTIFIKQGDLEEVMSMTGRLPFWTALLTEGLPKEPLLGFGYMRIAYTDAFQSVHTYAGKMTHNTFIQVLMNLGFIGFTVVMIQLITTLRGFFKTPDKADKAIFIGMFIPILVNSLTEFGIFGEANFGILFYQLLIWLVVLRHNPKLSLQQRILQKKKQKSVRLGIA